MALEIQSEIADSNEDLKQISSQDAKKIDQVVVQQIFGGNVYLATGQSSLTVQQQSITIGNWEQLERALRNSGVAQEKVDELPAMLKGNAGKMNSSILEWIKKTAPSVIAGGVTIGAAVGQTILTEYVRSNIAG